MPRVIAKADNLNQRNREFSQVALTRPVFLNSVPKCGTHLIRNILRMFVPVEQQYHDTFIQIPILRHHLRAFDPDAARLSWGHLLFSDESAIALQRVHHLILVRDPYDWVLARARFFLSDNFEGNLDHLKGGNVSVEEMLNMMIFGIHQKVPTLAEIFMHNGASWLGTGACLVRYEDLVRHANALDTVEAEAYFMVLLARCGIRELPGDWRQRVTIGANRETSATARENLTQGTADIPLRLPDIQKSLVDFAAPGLRTLLGYT